MSQKGINRAGLRAVMHRRTQRGATFVELMVLVAILALAGVATWALFGRAIREGAGCLGRRILDRGAACGAAPLVELTPRSAAPTSSKVMVPEGAVVCAGGQCRGGNCFAAGTLVATPDGPRRIEHIHEGDLVLSRDTSTGDDRPAPVVGFKVTPERETVLLGLDGDAVIEVTPEHPFWVAGAGWTAAGELAMGAELVGPRGSRVVRSLATSADRRTVYNLEVERTHTYFAGGVLVHNDCKALVAPTFTVRDLEAAGLSVRDRVLVGYYFLRLSNPDREQLNLAIREERLRGDEGRVGRLLVSRARSVFPLGLPREFDTGVGSGNFTGSLVDEEARFAAHVRRAQVAHKERLDDWSQEMRTGRRSPLRVFEPRTALPPIFDLPRITETDPAAKLKNPLAGNWMIEHDTDVRLIADAILEESGVEEKARFEKNDESWGYWAWRNVRDTGKAALWRAGGAFIAPDALKPEASGEERFRQRLTQDAFDFAVGVEVTRTEAGGVVLKPVDTPASVAALRVLLTPQNLAALDVASARAAGQTNARPDGTITREDFDAATRDFRSPEDFRRAAAHFTNPIVESDRVRRPLTIFDRFQDLDGKDGSTDGRVTTAGMQNMLAAKADGIPYQLAPSLHRILVRQGDGRESTPVDIIDWSKTVGSIHDAELAWLTGRMTTEEFDRFYNVTVAGRARSDAAEARLKLDADLDRLTAHGLDGVLAPDFEKDVGTVIKLGQLDGKYDQFVNRAWYEKLGVGTWGAVKEVLMVPVGLGELIVYAVDHGNAVVLIKGRPDGMPLLHVLAGQALANPFGTMDGISAAFDEWWLAAQVEPDRTTGQAVGFVATFFIPFEKVIKVARVSGSIGRTLALAAEARAVGDLARAERLLGRARQMTRLLTRMKSAEKVGEATRVGVTAEQVAREQAALEKLVAKTEDAVAKAEGELVRAVAGDVKPASAVAAAEAKPVASAPQAGRDLGLVEQRATKLAEDVRAHRSGRHEAIGKMYAELTPEGGTVHVVGPNADATQWLVPLLERRRVVVSEVGENLELMNRRFLGPKKSAAAYKQVYEVLGSSPELLAKNGIKSADDLKAFVQAAQDGGRLRAVEGAASVREPVDMIVSMAPLHLDEATRVDLMASLKPEGVFHVASEDLAVRFPELTGPTVDRVPLPSSVAMFPSDVEGGLAMNVPRDGWIAVKRPAPKAPVALPAEARVAEEAKPAAAVKPLGAAALPPTKTVPADKITLVREYYAGSKNSKLLDEYAGRMQAAAERGRVLFDGKPRTTEELQEVFRAMHREAKAGGGELVVDRVALNPADGRRVLANGRGYETEGMFRYLADIGVEGAERPAIRDVPAELSPGNVRGHQYPIWSAHPQYWNSASGSLNRFNAAVIRVEKAGTLAERAAAEAEALAELADFTHTMANLRPTNGSTNFGVVMAITNQGLVRMGKPPVFAGVLDMAAMRTNVNDFRRVFADHVAGHINLADEHRFERLLRYLDVSKRDGRPPPQPQPLPPRAEIPPARNATPAPPAPAPRPARPAPPPPPAAPPPPDAVAEGVDVVRAIPRVLEGASIRVKRTSGAFEDGWVVTSVEERGGKLMVQAVRADGTRRWQTLEDVAANNPTVLARFGDGNAIFIPAPKRPPAR